MKKQLILTTVALVVSILFLSGLAMAGPDGAVNLNWGYYLHNGDTACPSGKPLISVTRKITNSLDSGFGQNKFGTGWWATSDYNQKITVVETASNTFCATVTYQGKVTSVGGDGPGCNTDATDTCGDKQGLAAGVVATYQGGYTGTFTGEFIPNCIATRGNLGTLDADCDPSQADGDCTFSGSYTWMRECFDLAPEFPSFLWWGWVYHAGKNGTWVNAATPPGSSGNITGD